MATLKTLVIEFRNWGTGTCQIAESAPPVTAVAQRCIEDHLQAVQVTSSTETGQHGFNDHEASFEEV